MAIRITHDVVEVKRRGDANVRITHAVTEAMREGDPNVRITHAVVEIMRKTDAPISAQRTSMFLVFDNGPLMTF